MAVLAAAAVITRIDIRYVLVSGPKAIPAPNLYAAVTYLIF